MENKSIKDKILYWGGITLISSVVLGGSYYIYKSIFGSEKEDNNIDANDNNSLGNNSFILNDKNNNINNNNILNENNIDTSTSNNIHSSIFSKNNINEKKNNIEQSENNNIFNREEKIIQSNNIIHNDKENSLQNNIEKKDIDNSIDNKPQNNINIFNNNKILLKSFGINIDESKIFNNNNNHLTDEGTVRLIIYINFLSQKFFLIDYPTLDQKRRALLNNVNANINNNENNDLNINNENSENNINININNNEKQVQEEYLTLCNETIICKQNSYQMAADRILKSLSKPLNFQEFEEFLKNIEPKKLDELSLQIMTELNDELFKYDLDIMDINKTKEAYIFYLKIYIEQANKIYEQHEKMKNEEGNENNEENNIFIFQFMTLKIQMDDYLYEKYHIEDEHLKLLIKKYNLSIDNEISQLQTEFEEINEKFANDNKN